MTLVQRADRQQAATALVPFPALPFAPSGANRLNPSNETAATATVIEG